MLKSFTVTNFKNFENSVTFSLDSASNYEFNPEVVRDGCITKGLVFGVNGSGKSNLALAIFDIILHLTDKQRSLDKYSYYPLSYLFLLYNSLGQLPLFLFQYLHQLYFL